MSDVAKMTEARIAAARRRINLKALARDMLDLGMALGICACLCLMTGAIFVLTAYVYEAPLVSLRTWFLIGNLIAVFCIAGLYLWDRR